MEVSASLVRRRGPQPVADEAAIARSAVSRRGPRPRILIITRNLPPLTGGMERLNWHLADELGKGFDVCLCGPNGSREKLPAGIEAGTTFASRPLPRFLVESIALSARAAKQCRPALVIAGSGVTAPHARLASRLTGARTLVYLHGLDLIADHALYRAFFLPSIRRADRFLANSGNTAQLAGEAGIASERIEILHPGVRLPRSCEQGQPGSFRRMVDAGDRPILLSVGRLTPRKGLVEFVRSALPAIVAARPDVLLVVIGAEATDRLGGSRGNLGDRVRKEAARHGLSGHLKFLGRVDDDTLSQAYQASQVHVFPVLDIPGDVEGFGMVALEAAAHGLPTVAFGAGGILDAVAPGISGEIAPKGNYSVFAAAVIELLSGNHNAVTHDSCRRFSRQFAWDRFGERARQVCTDIIDQAI